MSWYRGPLLPGKLGETIPDHIFPAGMADKLLRYDATTGMLDASYASAWELGRLLMLRNKLVSVDYYHWKRTHIRSLKMIGQQHKTAHLPYRKGLSGNVALPDHIEDFLCDLSLLKGIPFQYLVPDEKMLPVESVRFFYLDPSWIESLTDGAMSIGHVALEQDKWRGIKEAIDSDESKTITGLLLRSHVVKGWPNMQVSAYNHSFPDNDQNRKNENIATACLPCIRIERLSEEILICLFEGELKIVDFYEKPETVHFGFDKGDLPNTYYKMPLNMMGKESDKKIDLNDELLNKETRQIHMLNLKETIKKTFENGSENLNFNSAQFALSMIEGVSRVRLIRD